MSRYHLFRIELLVELISRVVLAASGIMIFVSSAPRENFIVFSQSFSPVIVTAGVNLKVPSELLSLSFKKDRVVAADPLLSTIKLKELHASSSSSPASLNPQAGILAGVTAIASLVLMLRPRVFSFDFTVMVPSELKVSHAATLMVPLSATPQSGRLVASKVRVESFLAAPVNSTLPEALKLSQASTSTIPEMLKPQVGTPAEVPEIFVVLAAFSPTIFTVPVKSAQLIGGGAAGIYVGGIGVIPGKVN